MSQPKKSENTSGTNVFKLEYSPVAIRDLDRIWLDVYSASLSYDTTEAYINDLMDKVEDKLDFPFSGSPLYYENSFTGYYFVVFKTYIAFYRVEDDRMLVDRVLLGKSDYMSLLGFAI